MSLEKDTETLVLVWALPLTHCVISAKSLHLPLFTCLDNKVFEVGIVSSHACIQCLVQWDPNLGQGPHTAMQVIIKGPGNSCSASNGDRNKLPTEPDTAVNNYESFH